MHVGLLDDLTRWSLLKRETYAGDPLYLHAHTKIYTSKDKLTDQLRVLTHNELKVI